VIGYASMTGTRRNLAVLREAGWRVLLSPTDRLNPKGFRYALDNGAWTAHQQGTEWDVWKWSKAVANVGGGADWIVLPDIVCGGTASLDRSLFWLDEMKDEKYLPQLLIAVQNGMTADDLRPYVKCRVGIFVGGDTEWKEASLPMWGRLAKDVGCHMHVGRVNSKRRIKLCHMAGVDSFDGTSVSRFANTLPRLDAARRQGALELLPKMGGATMIATIHGRKYRLVHVMWPVYARGPFRYSSTLRLQRVYTHDALAPTFLRKRAARHRHVRQDRRLAFIRHQRNVRAPCK